MCLSQLSLSPFIPWRQVRDAHSQYGLAQISFSLRIIHNTTGTNHTGQQNANVLSSVLGSIVQTIRSLTYCWFS